MGALHEGHLSLVKRSKRENDQTVVSIFVNPTQFGPKEDLSRYPRPFKKDCQLLRKLNIDVIFAPSTQTMYSSTHATVVSVPSLSQALCGAPTSRGPQHFAGVATVVTKLFNVVRPTKAYFGMKDFQQLRIIEQLNEDLNLSVTVVRCPTVRENDGLAMSSRNSYLSSSERKEAPRLFQALQAGRKLLTSPSLKSLEIVKNLLRSRLEDNPPFKIDYIEFVDPGTLTRCRKPQRPILLALAVFLGKTRLIDNILVN
jgi:pantoate--beta-alanine ligase